LAEQAERIMAIAGPAIEQAERLWRMNRPAVEIAQRAMESAQIGQRAWESARPVVEQLSAMQNLAHLETIETSFKWLEAVEGTDPFEPLRRLRDDYPDTESAVLRQVPSAPHEPITAARFVDICRAAAADLMEWTKRPDVARGTAALFVFVTWWWLSMVAGRFDLAEKIDQSLLLLLAYLIAHRPGDPPGDPARSS
jgi:hypothetical protein